MNKVSESFEKRYKVTQLKFHEPKLKVPTRIGAWLQGFINGRTGSAAVDPKTSVIHSGYIRAYLSGYHSFCSQKRRILSGTVTSCVGDLLELLHRYRQLQGGATGENTPEAIRAEQARSSERASCLHDMTHLYALLDQNVRRYNCIVNDAAYRVSRGLAFYCRGVMFRHPVQPANLPDLEAEAEWCSLERDFRELVPVFEAVRQVLTDSVSKKEETKNVGKIAV